MFANLISKKLAHTLVILSIIAICVGSYQLLWSKNSSDSLKTFLIGNIRSCASDKPSNLKCLSSLASESLKKYSLEQIESSLEENKLDPDLSACHPFGHFLGRQGYSQEKNIKTVWDKCNTSCHNGCQHGIFEQYFMDKKLYEYDEKDLDALLTKEVPSLCGEPKDHPTPRHYSDCLHAIGHGAFLMTEQDLERSLRLCDAFESIDQSELCFAGIFHENTDSSTNEAHTRVYLDAKDPMYPCNTLDSRYQRVCYKYQGSLFRFFSGSWEGTVALCYKEPSAYQEDCFSHYGAMQAAFSGTVIRDNCYLISEDNFLKTCIKGAINNLSGKYIKQPQPLIALCASLREDLKPSCYSEMGEMIQGWSSKSSEYSQYCDQIDEKNYVSVCKNSLHL